MPNRILRDCCDSEKVNAVTVQAERLFYRIIQKADDYGRLVAEPKLLRPMLFPLLLDSVREADLQRWLDELEAARASPADVDEGLKKAGLIRLYEVGGKRYLEINDFRQQRRSESKYPAPDDEQLRSKCAADAQQLRTKAKAYAEAQTKAQGPAPPAGSSAKTVKGIEIPESLRTPGFLAAWKKWETHLREKRVRTTSLADEEQLAKCEAWGPIEAVRNIHHSIAGNYQGLFPAKGENGRNGAGGTPAPSRRKTVLHGEV